MTQRDHGRDAFIALLLAASHSLPVQPPDGTTQRNDHSADAASLSAGGQDGPGHTAPQTA